MVVPALGDKEDFKYLGLLRAGAQFNGGGQIFELVDDCDFSSPYSVEGVPNRTKIPNFDANGNLVNYTMTKREVIVNGTTKIFKKEILDSNNKPFFKLFLPEKNIISVTSIIQKPGVGYQSLPNSSEFISPLANKWYEVDALAQNEVFVEDPSSPPDNVGIKVGTYVTAPQRFVTEYTPEGFFFLTFGGGNQTSQDLLDEFTSKGVKLDMSKFMNNIALGNTVKGNSTLFIQYRVGGGKSSNIGAGAVRNIGLVDFVVAGPSQQVNQSVINSLSINNVTSAIGGADPMTQDEIRNYISFNFAAQKRAVTINDYVSQLRTMPSSFGSPAKASATEIENKIKLSVLSYTPGGTLTSNVSSTLKNNIATYLSNHRMINDYIMVGSAKVIDLRLEIDLIIANGVNQSEVVTSVISIVGEYFKTDKIEMGQDLALGELRKQIMNQDGVVNIVDVRVYNQVGDPYSQSVSTQPYINATTKQIGLIDDTIFAQPDEILQIMSPQKDISVRTKRNTKPTFS